MIVTKTNPETGLSTTRSINVTPQLLHDIRVDVLDDNLSVIESGKLDHLSAWEITFLYLGTVPDFTGMTTEQKLAVYHEGIKTFNQ